MYALAIASRKSTQNITQCADIKNHKIKKNNIRGIKTNMYNKYKTKRHNNKKKQNDYKRQTETQTQKQMQP